MKKFYSISLLIAVLASSIFVSCVKENAPAAKPNQPEAEAEQYYVLSYDRFDFEDDVQILDADTVQISVSKDYLDKLGYKFQASEAEPVAVTIWQSINTAPYVRNITATAEQDDRVILTTKSGDIGDVFGNTDFVLETEFYLDKSQPLAVTRGGELVENYDRYTDEEGVIHPAVVIIDKQYDEPIPSFAHVPTRGGNAYFTPEMLEQSNGSVDFNIINTKFNIGEFKITSPEDEQLGLELGLDEVNVSLVSNLRISFATKWFKLKQFECTIYGKNKFDLTSSITIDGRFKKELEKELFKCNCFTTVFWVGVVPVSVSMNAGLQAVGEVNLNASATFSSTYTITDTYEYGARYSDEKWYGIANSKRESGFTDFYISPVTTELSAMFGLELFADLKFYGCVGPKITFGPHIEASISAAYNALDDTIDLETMGEFYLGGEYGIELQIWKWKLAAFKHKYNVLNNEPLWEQSMSVPYDMFRR